MLTQTSELAIRSLIFIGLSTNGHPLTPKLISEHLNCSPSYLAKVIGNLARAGIVRTTQGSRGGVSLTKNPKDITLVSIVEACQGLITSNYCQDVDLNKVDVCGFHEAMIEIHTTTIRILSKWTLSDLMKSPVQTSKKLKTSCKMYFKGCEKYCCKTNNHHSKTL